MIINLNRLSEDKLNLIPLSIQLHSFKHDDGILDLDSLPYDVIHELKALLDPEISDQSPVIKKTIVDLSPKLNVYNDFVTFETKKEAIIEYIKNYFTLNRGSYPFDPTFGSRLKEYLNTLDTPTQHVLIANEVDNLVNSLLKSFDMPISVKDILVVPVNLDVSSEVNISMTVQITEQSITDNFKVELTHFVA